MDTVVPVQNKNFPGDGKEFAKRKVHFAALMDICHLKNAELKQKHQKYKGRVVLRGDNVKDDSGAYAVFTEQRFVSFANDCCQSDGRHCEIAGMCWTSRRRSISLQPGKNGGRPKVAAQFQCFFHDTSGPNLGQTSKTQWFLLKEMCAVTGLVASCGKDKLRKLYWNLDEGKYRIGNVHLFIENMDYSYRCTWMISEWLERSRIWLPCGRI